MDLIIKKKKEYFKLLKKNILIRREKNDIWRT
jgi:hypothetical protein